MSREVVKKKTARREILIATGVYLATILRAVVRAHRTSDELQRRIDAEAAIVSAVLVGLGSFAAGLALAAVDPNPRVHGIYVLVIGPALMGTWGLAKSWLERRYRPPVERVV